MIYDTADDGTYCLTAVRWSTGTVTLIVVVRSC